MNDILMNYTMVVVIIPLIQGGAPVIELVIIWLYNVI